MDRVKHIISCERLNSMENKKLLHNLIDVNLFFFMYSLQPFFMNLFSSITKKSCLKKMTLKLIFPKGEI
jgi:hypothetical protein